MLNLFRINPEELTSLLRLTGLKILGGEHTVFRFTFKFNFLYPCFGVGCNSFFLFFPKFPLSPFLTLKPNPILIYLLVFECFGFSVLFLLQFVMFTLYDLNSSATQFPRGGVIL